MRVKNVSGVDRQIAATGQTVDAGEVAEVPDDLGGLLCEQVENWVVADDPRSKRKEGDD